MKTIRVALFLAPLVLSGVATANPERTLSASRQFVVYGTNVALRGVVSDSAEEVKANLLALLRRSDTWKTPIVINLQFPQANVPEVPPAALQFSQTGAGLKLQLDLTVAADFNNEMVQRELLRAILLEMVYRNQTDIAPGSVYVEAPDWLLDGVMATANGRETRTLAKALEPLLGAKTVPSLTEFFQQPAAPSDSLGRLLHRAFAAAFLKWILDDSNGRVQLGRYIDNLSSASNDALADLKAYFPFLKEEGLESKWRSRVARFCEAQDYQLLSFAETRRQLDDLIAAKRSGAGSEASRAIDLDQLTRKKISRPQARALLILREQLILLRMHANPALGPVINEYQQIAELLARGKNLGTNDRLARLSATRTKIAGRMEKIDDYMNWFEATQARTRSGAFADYLDAASGREIAPPRRDPISVYLDALDEQVQD